MCHVRAIFSFLVCVYRCNINGRTNFIVCEYFKQIALGALVLGPIQVEINLPRKYIFSRLEPNGLLFFLVFFFIFTIFVYAVFTILYGVFVQCTISFYITLEFKNTYLCFCYPSDPIIVLLWITNSYLGNALIFNIFSIFFNSMYFKHFRCVYEPTNIHSEIYKGCVHGK